MDIQIPLHLFSEMQNTVVIRESWGKLELPSLEVVLTTFRPLTLTFNPRRAIATTHIHKKGQGQRSFGSKRVETNGQTEPIALPSSQTRSVATVSLQVTTVELVRYERVFTDATVEHGIARNTHTHCVLLHGQHASISHAVPLCRLIDRSQSVCAVYRPRRTDAEQTRLTTRMRL